VGQQAVDAGDSHVVDVLDVVAHQFGGDYGFFGYGMSLVPAETTTITPFPCFLRSRFRTMARARDDTPPWAVRRLRLRIVVRWHAWPARCRRARPSG